MIYPPEDLAEGMDHSRLIGDIREEFETVGEVASCVIPERGQAGEGAVYVEFKVLNDARNAMAVYFGKTFQDEAGVVEVGYCNEEWFKAVLQAGGKLRDSRDGKNAWSNGLTSSFSGNVEMWFQHTNDEGRLYYSQPKTGAVTWVKPKREKNPDRCEE